MRNTPDGDGTLLDHSLLMIGGGMSDGNIHSHMDVPIALVGGAGGLKGNRHVATPMGTPLSNLLVGDRRTGRRADRQLRRQHRRRSISNERQATTHDERTRRRSR